MAAVRMVEQGVGEFVLLDVRDAASYAAGHIPGALNLPLAELDERAGALAREAQYVTYCWRDT
jgi:rhodanese-related sulfurtransferase